MGFFEFLKQLPDAIIAFLLTALVAGIGWLLNRINKWLKVQHLPYRQVIDAVLGTPDQKGILDIQRDQGSTLDSISKEMKTNGGSTLRDAVVATQANTLLLLGLFEVRDDNDTTRAYMRTDANGFITWVSRTYIRWTSRSLSESVGLGWIACIHPSDRNKVRAEWEASIIDRRVFAMRYRMSDGAGGSFTVQCTASPISDGRNNVLGWYGSVAKVESEDR